MKKIICLLTISIVMISCSNNENTLKFKKSDFEGEWPFSVEEIEVYCEGYKEIYCKASNGKIYPLNGSAKSASRDNYKISDIQEIWLDNPEYEGLKISYSTFIEKGLKLCENK